VRGVRAEVLADHRLGRLLHPECGDDRERGDARADRVRRDPGRAAGDRYEAHHEHADQFAHSALATEGSPTATTSRTTERSTANASRVSRNVSRPIPAAYASM